MLINNTFVFKNLIDENRTEFSANEDEMKNAFAKCLKELRQFMGLTLKQVAKGTGIPLQTIARYESGENTPSVIQAFKFSFFYNIEIYDMFLAGFANYETREKIFEECIK